MRLFMASGVRHAKAHVTEKTKPLLKESAKFNNGQADELAKLGNRSRQRPTWLNGWMKIKRKGI